MFKKQIMQLMNDLKNGVVVYDNATSGLTSTDVKNAIDELNSNINNIDLFEFVETLPTTNINEKKIYVVNATEYYWDSVNGIWEVLGVSYEKTPLFYDIVEIEESSWILNESLGLYEANVAHSLNSDDIIVQVYSNDVVKKLIDFSIDVVDSSNLKVKTIEVCDCVVYIIALNSLTSFELVQKNVAGITDAITQSSFVISKDDFVEDSTDANFFNTTLTHNLGKTIAKIECFNNTTDDEIVFLKKVIDENSMIITIVNITKTISDDIRVEIVYETI